MAGYNAHTRGAQKKELKKKGVDLKKLLQAGALITEAGSRGSSGGIASKLHESEIDLSGKSPFGKKFQRNPKTEANEQTWKPEKETLGDFPNKNSNYNV